MKSITLSRPTPHPVHAVQLTRFRALHMADLAPHVITAACMLAAWVIGITATTWLLAQGGAAVAGALLFAGGFVFLALALDRPGMEFVFPLISGLLMCALSLSGQYVASEFFVVAAMVPGFGLGQCIRRKLNSGSD